jgi:hypothetical protein
MKIEDIDREEIFEIPTSTNLIQIFSHEFLQLEVKAVSKTEFVIFDNAPSRFSKRSRYFWENGA